MNKKAAGKKRTKTKSQGFASAFSQPSNGFPYAGSITPGKQSPQRTVVDDKILLPDYAKDGTPKKGKNGPLLPWIIEVKTPEEIKKMRAAGKLAREVLDLGGRAVAAGVTTDEIDRIVHEATVKVGPKV
jgi:methionyl aminopeptidase